MSDRSIENPQPPPMTPGIGSVASRRPLHVAVHLRQTEASMAETKRDVFVALLQAWRDDEDAIIHERSHDIDADTAEADRLMAEWSQRFEDAR